jgi:hypothetical protein
MATDYKGLLFIGDPHLASQVPGFRKDDFPRVALEKLRFCLDHARENNLLPAILGDLFHWPRDNANWLVGEVIALLRVQEVLAIHGNHDCREDSLLDHDSFSILDKAMALRRVDEAHPWMGAMNGRKVIIGGSCWGQPIPSGWDKDPGAFVAWLTHHDLKVPGYDQGYFAPRPLPGIQLMVNGHIHRTLDDVICDGTTWVTPGNIVRVSRSDASRLHVPSVLRVDIHTEGWEMTRVHVPHSPFENVFHDEILDAPESSEGRSTFIDGLAELEALRTVEGAGFKVFLEKNLSQFEPDVQDEIQTLWNEVMPHG